MIKENPTMNELKTAFENKTKELENIISDAGMNTRDKGQLSNFVDRFTRSPEATGYIKDYEVIIPLMDENDKPVEFMTIHDFVALAMSQNSIETSDSDKETIKEIKTSLRKIKGYIVDKTMCTV